LPLPGSKGQFAKLVSAVAATAKKIKAKEWDNPTKGLIELRLSDGTVMVIDTKNETVIVRCPGTDGCLSMIEHLSGDELRQVMRGYWASSTRGLQASHAAAIKSTASGR